MFIPPKVARRNLLQYAEGIGGKQMYLRMNKALRDAHLHNEESLNRDQLDSVIDKLAQQEDVSLDKMKIKQLIDEKERRRQVYIKMAIESESDEFDRGSADIGGIGGGVGGSKRYDYRKMPAGPQNIGHTAGSAPISSIARIKNNSNLKAPGKGSSHAKNFGPKSSAIKQGPVSSISHIKR